MFFIQFKDFIMKRCNFKEEDSFLLQFSANEETKVIYLDVKGKDDNQKILSKMCEVSNNMILVIILIRNTVISIEGQERVNRETWYKRGLQAFFKSS